MTGLARCVPPTLLLLLSACSGYSTSRIEAFPQARNIAVLPFENTGFRRDLELRLTEAVLREIRGRTSFGLATPETADLLLSGEITDAREQLLVQGGDRQAIQKRLFGVVIVRVRDRATGRIVKERSVADREEFESGIRGQDLDSSATDEWARRMAVQIVQVLERDF
jgi:hypothetical protein